MSVGKACHVRAHARPHLRERPPAAFCQKCDRCQQLYTRRVAVLPSAGAGQPRVPRRDAAHAPVPVIKHL
eukprot:357766-Chlamydomonas_euryale.AAC.2